MKMNDINKKFTEKVSEYINKGYIFYAAGMSGNQGEIAKVTLSKDNQMVMIYLEEETSFRFNTTEWSGRSVVLNVGFWKYDVKGNTNRTIWINDIEVFEKTTYYKIDNDWYVEDLEEALSVQNKQQDRYSNYKYIPSNYSGIDVTNDKTKEVAVMFLKKSLDCKRVSRDHISITKRRLGEEESCRIYYVIKYYSTTLFVK